MDSLFPLPVERLSFWHNVESNRLYALSGSDDRGFEFKKDSWIEYDTVSFSRNTDFSEFEDVVELSSNEAKSFILNS